MKSPILPAELQRLAASRSSVFGSHDGTNHRLLCISNGPSLGIFGLPVPVSPYYQHRQEEKFWQHERYDRVPVLGPTTAGGPPVALDPPTDDEIIHALERARPVQGGIPFLYEKQRNNVRIIKEKIADYTDPCRFYPLIGQHSCTMHTTSARFTAASERSSAIQFHTHWMTAK